VDGALDSSEDKNIVAAIIGEPLWNDRELKSIADQHGSAKALITGYRNYDAEVLTSIGGAFALALRDEENSRTFLATDRYGVWPLFFGCTNDLLAFASTADAVAAHSAIARNIDPQGIFNYVYFHVVPGPRTIYRRIHRLLPGHYLCIEKNKHIQAVPYWQMQFREDNASSSLRNLKDEFLSLLRDSVRRAATGQRTGAFLSGGTDSSTVAGFLGEVTGSPAQTYSIGFDADGYDEMEYARIAARHFGTEHHEYYVTPGDVAEAVPTVAKYYDQPFGNASAIPTYYCARLAAADGVECLLGGDGGDELFGGNYRYAKQQYFSYYTKLPGVVREGLIEPALASLPSVARVGLVDKLDSYVKQAKIPMPHRLETYNLLNRIGANAAFSSDFLTQVDSTQPHDLIDEAYTGFTAHSMLNRMLALDMRFTLADSDLPKVSKMCELGGIGVRYPLLSDSIVDFSCRLPPRQKLKGTKLRYFFKEALRDFLPVEILEKKKHGFGLPFGLWLQGHKQLRELAYDTLEELKRRKIFRSSFIDDLTDKRHQEHAAYYGTMVWILMMLEQWMKARQI
jgi:asparagine synthase (glutamine-hydrolysing)